MTNATPDSLRDAVLRALIRRVEEGESVLPKGAEESIHIDAPPATLSAAINFLKVFPPEGPTEGADELSSKLKQMGKQMPFPSKAEQERMQ